MSLEFWSGTRCKKPFDDTMSELRLRQYSLFVSFKKKATLDVKYWKNVIFQIFRNIPFEFSSIHFRYQNEKIEFPQRWLF